MKPSDAAALGFRSAAPRPKPWISRPTASLLLQIASVLASACSGGPAAKHAEQDLPEGQHTPLPALKSGPEAEVATALVSLSAPPSRAEVTALVARYLHGIVRESAPELGTLLTEDATLLVSGERKATLALATWNRRFRQYDYTARAAAIHFQTSELELYSHEEASRLHSIRGLRLRPQADEWLFRLHARKAPEPGLHSLQEGILTSTEHGLQLRAVYESSAPSPR